MSSALRDALAERDRTMNARLAAWDSEAPRDWRERLAAFRELVGAKARPERPKRRRRTA